VWGIEIGGRANRDYAPPSTFSRLRTFSTTTTNTIITSRPPTPISTSPSLSHPLVFEMSFRLRLRLPSSKQETLTLPSPVTIRTLLNTIAPLLNTDPHQIELRTIYPPKSIDLGSEDAWTRDIRDVGIQNGEGLIVSLRTPTSAEEEETPTVVPAKKEEEAAKPSEAVKPSVPVAQTNRAIPVQKSLRSSPLARVNKDEPPEIEVEGGTVILRIMEDDNSCMFFPHNTRSQFVANDRFNALIYCIGRGAFQAADLRQSTYPLLGLVGGLLGSCCVEDQG
jgi:hypothetical protein